MGLVFSDNGYVVHNADKPHAAYPNDLSTPDSSDFQGRVPLIVKDRDIYVGRPNWYHDHVMGYHGVYSSPFDHPHGYFGGGKNWGNGDLSWYGYKEPTEQEHGAIAEALQEAGYPIPNPTRAAPHLYDDDEDLWDDDPAPKPDLDFWHP